MSNYDTICIKATMLLTTIVAIEEIRGLELLFQKINRECYNCIKTAAKIISCQFNMQHFEQCYTGMIKTKRTFVLWSTSYCSIVSSRNRYLFQAFARCYSGLVQPFCFLFKKVG